MTLNRNDAIQVMLDGFIEDMEFMYKNGGMAEEDIPPTINAARNSFLFLCSNAYDRLADKGVVVKDA